MVLSSKNLFDQMPEDMIVSIFERLDPITLNRCCQVSKKWRQLATKDYFWRRLFPSIVTTEIHRYLCQKTVLNCNRIFPLFLSFIKEEPHNENKILRVSFFYNPHYNIELSYENSRGDEERALVKTVSLLNKFTEIANPPVGSHVAEAKRFIISMNYQFPDSGQLPDDEKRTMVQLISKVHQMVQQKKFPKRSFCTLGLICLPALAIVATVVCFIVLFPSSSP